MRQTTEYTDSFDCIELRAVIKAAATRIDNYNSTLDKISRDIKSLEGLLIQKGISFPYHYVVSDDFVNRPRISETDTHIEVTGVIKKVRISWEEYGNSGFRLLYVEGKQHVTRDRNGKELFSGEQSAEEITERKPLIECKTGVRIALFPNLPYFVEGLTSCIPNVDGDIPF